MDLVVASDVNSLQLGFWARLLAPFGIGTLGRVAKSQGLIKKAGTYSAANNAGGWARAIPLYTQAIELLAATTGMDAERTMLLGMALTGRGKAQQFTNDASGAVSSYLQARKQGFILSLDALEFAATALTNKRNQDPEAIGIYLDLVRQLKGNAKPLNSRAIYAFLEQCCTITETTPQQEMPRLFALCTRVTEADPDITWAYYYIGIWHFNRQNYAEALASFQKAKNLGSAKQQLDFYIDFSTARELLGKNRYQEALPSLRAASNAAPTRADLSFLLGHTLLELVAAATSKNSQVDAWLAEAISALTLARQRDEGQAEYAFYLGRAHFLAHNYDQAAQSLQTAIGLDGSHAAWHLQLGVTQRKRNLIKEAIEAVRASLSVAPEDIEANSLLGELLVEIGAYAAAIEPLQKVLKLRRNDLPARAALGIALYFLQRFEEAIQYLTPVEGLPDRARFCLARAYAQRSEFNLAIEQLKALTERLPSDAEAWYYLALAYAHTNQFSLAIETFGTAIGLDAGQGRFYVQRGHALAKTGQWGAARSDYLRALEFDPNDVASLYALACACRALNDNDAAIAALTGLLRLDANHIQARLMLGMLQEKAGAIEQALAEYKAAMYRAPSNAEVCRRIAVLHWKQKEYEQAAAELERGVSLGDNCDEHLYYLGWSAAQQGDFARTLDAWTRLSQRHPDDQRLTLNINRLHYIIGKIHMEAGRYTSAISEWNAYLAPRPDDEELKMEIGKLYFRIGLGVLQDQGVAGVTEAKSALQHASTLVPANSVYRYYMAFCDLLEGQWQSFVQNAGMLTSALDPPMQLQADYHIGMAYLLHGAPEQAEPFLRSARDKAPKLGISVDLSLPFAMIYARAQRFGEAADLLCGG
jgi:tetratricopeptide (TPR) repeat protein